MAEFQSQDDKNMYRTMNSDSECAKILSHANNNESVRFSIYYNHFPRYPRLIEHKSRKKTGNLRLVRCESNHVLCYTMMIRRDKRYCPENWLLPLFPPRYQQSTSRSPRDERDPLGRNIIYPGCVVLKLFYP